MIRALAFAALVGFPTLVHAGTIVGRVVERDTGLPLSEFQVRFQSPATAVNTTESGWFVLGNLAPGLYWAEVSGSYHERKFVRMSVGDTTLIELRRTGYPAFQAVHPFEDPRFVDPTPPPVLLGSVRVRATDEQGRAIVGISVHVDPGGFSLTDSSGWSRFPKAAVGWHPIRIGSLLHEIQVDSVLVKDGQSETRQYVMRVREPYRRGGVALNANGDLRVGDVLHLRDGGMWIECSNFPFNIAE